MTVCPHGALNCVFPSTSVLNCGSPSPALCSHASGQTLGIYPQALTRHEAARNPHNTRLGAGSRIRGITHNLAAAGYAIYHAGVWLPGRHSSDMRRNVKNLHGTLENNEELQTAKAAFQKPQKKDILVRIWQVCYYSEDKVECI